MSTDFPDTSKTVFPIVDGEETIVGVHSSGIMLEEGLNTSNSRNYCSNCRKKIHCYVKVNKITKEAKIHITCKNSSCECKCKTHFACKRCGYLHPYGQKCNYIESEIHYTSEDNIKFDKLMDKWRKADEEKKSKVQNVK